MQTLRHELLDRTLVWNERHRRHALHEFEQHHNAHRPHQAMKQAAPGAYALSLNPSPILNESPASTYADTIAWQESSTSIHTLLDLHGRGFRQAQG